MANVTSADSSDRSKAVSARLWVQAVALPVVATLFTLVAFYYKEILIPSTAPINLTTDVSVKSAGLGAVSGEQDKGLEAIELTVTARNPSSRTIYLLANSWMAYGYKITEMHETDEETVWLKDMLSAISAKSYVVNEGKHYKKDGGTLLALGNVFTDDLLHPNEKISATYVFHVPQGIYDLIHIDVNLPTASRENPALHGTAAVANVYTLSSDNSSLLMNLFRVTQHKQFEALPVGKDGNWSEDDKKHYGLQAANSSVDLSLWQSKTTGTEVGNLLDQQ